MCMYTIQIYMQHIIALTIDMTIIKLHINTISFFRSGLVTRRYSFSMKQLQLAATTKNTGNMVLPAHSIWVAQPSSPPPSALHMLPMLASIGPSPSRHLTLPLPEVLRHHIPFPRPNLPLPQPSRPCILSSHHTSPPSPCNPPPHLPNPVTLASMWKWTASLQHLARLTQTSP